MKKKLEMNVKMTTPWYWLVALALFAPAMALAADEATMAEALLRAEAGGKPIPVLSADHPDLDLDAAYRVQHAYVERRLATDSIAGFKSGLTGTLGQLWFGIDEPVSGELFASGRAGDGATIDLAALRRLIVETEIVFVVGTPIAAPVKDVAALRPMIRGVAPGIEMPEGGFDGVRRVKAVDIVAANVSASRFIVGAERPADGLDLKHLVATLSRDGRRISRGRGSDAMGDPWEAALWLVNAAVKQGWTLTPGQVLSSGILGKRIEAEPGAYLADFGVLGKIGFRLK